MKIVVVSDSHNNESAVQKVKEYVKDADVLLFLGDGEEDLEDITENFKGQLYAVRGNCDFSREIPEERLLVIEDKRIFMCHGHRYNVKYDYNNIYYRGREVEADIVLFGHSHKPMIENNNGMILMNPGSISHGPALTKRSIGIIELEDNRSPRAYLQELR